MKQIIIRVGFVIVLILIGVALFYAGKGHTILSDNKNITVGGVEYKALDFAEITIDNGEDREILKRDRIKDEVSGQRHKIAVTYVDDNGSEQIVEKSFSLDVSESMYLLSIPALIGGAEEWIEVFEPLN